MTGDPLSDLDLDREADAQADGDLLLLALGPQDDPALAGPDAEAAAARATAAPGRLARLRRAVEHLEPAADELPGAATPAADGAPGAEATPTARARLCEAAAALAVVPVEDDAGAAKPKPLAGGGYDPARAAALGIRVSLACAYCHDRLPRPEVVFCAACLAPHHDECFRAHGRCSAPGCAETQTVRPADPTPATPATGRAPARRGGRGWLALLPVSLGLGAVAAIVATGEIEGGPATSPQLDDETRALARQLEESSARAEQMRKLLEEANEQRARRTEPAPSAERLAAEAEERLRAGDVDAFRARRAQLQALVQVAEVSASREVRDRVAAAATRVEQLWRLVSDEGAARVDLAAKDTPLADVARALAARAGRPIYVDPAVQERVTAEVSDLPWPDALDLVARLARCEVEVQGGALALTQPPRVTLQFTDANVQTVLQLLAAYSGKSVVLAPGAGARSRVVTLDLNEVHWARALAGILQATGLRARQLGPDVVLVTAEESAAGRPFEAPVPWRVALALTPPGLDVIDLAVEGKPLAAAIDELARVLGKPVRLRGPGHEQSRAVEVRLHEVPRADAPARFARAVGLWAWEGPHDVAFEVRAPWFEVHARGVNVRTYAQALGAVAGYDVVMGADAVGAVSLDLAGVAPGEGLTLGLAAGGCRAERYVGIVHVSRASTIAAPAASPAPARHGARALPRPTLTVVGIERPAAVLADRLHRAGDDLVDPATDEVVQGVRVAEVLADRVVYDVEGERVEVRLPE